MIGAESNLRGSPDSMCPTIGLRFRVWCGGFGVWGASRGSKIVTQHNGEEIPENQRQDMARSNRNCNGKRILFYFSWGRVDNE